MSGEDDLRARLTALRDELDAQGSPMLNRDAVVIAMSALLATPAEPARESDGVGLRLTGDEREALVDALHADKDLGPGYMLREDCEHLADRFLASDWLAARVAEAGARALEDLVEAIKVRRAEPDDFGRQGRARYTAGLSWAADRAKERAEELRRLS